MRIVREPIPLDVLRTMAARTFVDLVKAVVDVERGVMSVDAELHSDEEAQLLEDGSQQQHLWGINLYPGVEGEDWIEYDSVINIRPWQENRSRGVEDPGLRAKIAGVVDRLVER
jgi:hypothetical protein